MKNGSTTTVRFSQVIQKSGKPVTYLLWDRNDKNFAQALKNHRIMTLVSSKGGAKTESGFVATIPNNALNS
jgi:hypothetical protein